MDVKELRIGNFVKYMDEFLPVLAIDSEKELKEYNLLGTVTLPTFWNGRRMSCQGRWMNQVEPIPLTEEWLIKAGFVKVRDYPVFRFNCIQIELNILKKIWIVRLGVIDIEIKYVHQLQNLYFCLTGEY